MAILFGVVASIQLGVALYGTYQTRRFFNSYALLVLLVVYGLAYDNFALAAGGWWPEGELLKTLHAPRYWLHALFTPAMMIAAFGALRRTGSHWAQSKLWHVLVCVLATALILLGSYVDIVNLNLAPKVVDGLTRYTNTFVLLKGPPLPALVTILVTLAMGVVLWRNIKFPWLFVGSLLMLLTAGVMQIPLVQNFGEIAFATGLVVTQIRAHPATPTIA